ncbi:MAG: hypothetical protein KAT68_05930 [Bacteroidales bacterium]|nr:hypothetical protein [Bacteroidales bacterium]
MKPDLNIDDVRNNLFKCLIERGSLISNALIQHDIYCIHFKGWCIVVFMASLGFCLTQDPFYFYFFPLITVLIFWYNDLYQHYMRNDTSDDLENNYNLINDIYQIDDIQNLLEIFKEVNFRIQGKDNNKHNWKRFIRKMKYIIKIENLLSLENLSFYVVLIIILVATFLFIHLDILKLNINN